MSETADPGSAGDRADHEMAECLRALEQAQDFLHDEMSEADCEALRRHLNACERCMEHFDVEVAIAALLRRCVRLDRAPDGLRAAVSSLRVDRAREAAPDERPGPVAG